MGSAVAELALGSPAEGGPVRSLPWPGTTEGVIETRPSAHRGTANDTGKLAGGRLFHRRCYSLT
jgi:hypothetical protein